MKYKMTTMVDVSIPERGVPCSADVLLWNYWDGEHLLPVHGGYTYAKLLYQGQNFSLCLFGTKPPLVPLSIPTFAFVVQSEKYVQMTYAIQLFIISKTTIRITPITHSTCSVKVDYSMACPRWIPFASIILRRLIPMWFERVYKEDMPLRLRRQRVLEAGFIDYVGMPRNLEQKAGCRYVFKQPVMPSPGSPLLGHPYYSDFNSKF